MLKLWATIADLLETDRRATLATIIEGQEPGSTGLYSSEGELLAGQDVGYSKKTGLVQNTNTLYVETLTPRPALVIFGGGHVAVPVAKIGKLTDFEVHVNDDRPEFANKSRFPEASSVLAMGHNLAFDQLALNSRHYVVIVTRGHVHDRDCLVRALGTEAAYIGMIGSKKKALEVNQWLIEQGFTQQDLRRVFSPIGLEIEAETPEEIAVSIMAEVIKERSKRRPPANLGEIANAILTKSDRETWGLVTIVEAGGSTPRGVGARMLVKPDGSIVGTVGGGPGEKEAEEIALEVCMTKVPRLVPFKLTSTIAAGQGMVCGGNFTMFIQPV